MCVDRSRTDCASCDRSRTDRASCDRSRTDRTSCDRSRTDRASCDRSRTDRASCDRSRAASHFASAHQHRRIRGHRSNDGRADCMAASPAKNIMTRLTNVASITTYITISVIGLTAFLSPFWTVSYAADRSAGAHATDAPIMTAALIALALIAMMLDAQQVGLGVKQIAMLGVLAAINSALRFAEVALPGPGGFTPIFLLIICGGFAYGPRFGFLLGALSLLTSAIATAGIGPWLPFQMYTAGWMGLSAGWLGALANKQEMHLSKRTHFVLIMFGTAWGFAYGAIMNLWSWPFTMVRLPADDVFVVLNRYAAYYATTSFVWDLYGAAGNALLLTLFAPAAVRSMRRFRQRLTFHHRSST